MRTASIVLFSVLLIFFAASVDADNSEGWGPEIGQVMPADLVATTQDGETVKLYTLSGENGTAIAFVRSADWCPFCKRQLIELNDRREDFAKRGIRLIALSYDSPQILKDFATERNIEYTLLSDPKSEVIDAFGIRNLDYEDKDSKGYGIPLPGIMVFDVDCNLTAKFAEKDYRKRPSIDSVLEKIDSIRKTTVATQH